MRLPIVVFLLLGIGQTISYAQHQEVSELPMPYKGRGQSEKDSMSILSAFKHGKVNGHFRYFFMSTNNADGLTDYYANAAGGGIRFETASFYGVRFAVGGSYVFDLASSDFTVQDSLTGAYSRYEIGLYDIAHPESTNDLDRLEELYLSYTFKASDITFGRQFINTPFINLQDGRMRPGAVEGVVVHFKEITGINIESGYLYAMTPRSTVDWYSVANSIGLYPSGVNPDGTRSDYKGNLKSGGIGFLGVKTKWNDKLAFQFWDVFLGNVMNTAMLQVDLVRHLQNKDTWTASAQVIRQDGVGNGGSDVQSQTYYSPNGKSMAFGLKTGYKSGRIESSVNYSRITSSGRYLMPREWGRDPLFTFLPRERNEGLGDVHAIVGKFTYTIPKSKLSAGLGLGYYSLPDVKNTALNKYGMPSYTQVNLDLRYFFRGLFEGLDVQYLLAAKMNAGETYGNDKYVINKVDMQVHNLVLNFHF
jgi:hypothetical protein